MKRNRRLSETELLDQFAGDISDLIPDTWRFTSRTETAFQGDRGIDMVLELAAPDGSRGLILVEVKRRLEPRLVPMAAAQIMAFGEAMGHRQADGVARVLVSEFLSPRTRELLREAGIGWYDTTGNLRLAMNRPSLFLSRDGAERDPRPNTDDRRLKSLKGPGAARVVRALLDGAEDTRVRALAEQAEVGAATSARVLGYLAQERLVDRDERASVQRVRKQSLVRAWARDYGVTESNFVTPVLAPRGLGWLMEQLAERRLPHVLAGSAALRRHLPEDLSAVAPMSMLMVYSNEVPRLKRELRLREVDQGANTLLVEPFDEVVLRGAGEEAGHRYTALSQTVADLLTSPGRGPQEAEQLIEAIAVRDEEWKL